MMTIERYDTDVWAVSRMLTPAECAEFVELGEAEGFEAATVSLPTGAKMMSHIRNNDRVVHDDVALADVLWERVKPYAPAQVDGFAVTGLNPRFRFYRYEPGQQFKRHLDGRVRLESGEVSRVTLLFYLNDGCEGGETVFSDWGFSTGKSFKNAIRVSPKVGSALFFTHECWHEGAPVRAGIKYVLRTDVLYAGEPKAPSKPT